MEEMGKDGDASSDPSYGFSFAHSREFVDAMQTYATPITLQSFV